MASLQKRSASVVEPSRAEEFDDASSQPVGRKASSRTSGLPGLLSRLTTRAWERDDDISRRTSDSGKSGRWLTFLALTFQSIGVVYGDIGTSFIYVFPSVYRATPSEEDVIGAVSLVVWTISSIVLVKYALIVLRADDNGQGGAFALYSLLRRQAEIGSGSQSLNRSLSQYSTGRRTGIVARLASGTGAREREHKRQLFIESPLTQNILRVLVVVGVGAIMGDGVLTPSVSVVSACEGINVRWPSVSRGVIDGIAIAIVVVLFGIQQFGTHFIGLIFSPIVTIWLLANAVIGIYNIATFRPGIFIALSPHKWFAYFLRNGREGWRSLGGVLLCVTGCEALFADLGHFSRPAIQTSFIGLCWPCLILTYLGQGAYLVRSPDKYGTVFWDSLPHGTFYPMFILATCAAIIASQALISAAFQIVKQAIAQGFFPRFTVIHTSKKHHGQIYIPFICYLLGGLCVIVIATFKTSLQLTKAYGLAVIIDMLLTTHFASLVIFCVWKLPFIFPLAFYLVFATIEATFLSATAEKVPTGGWFSLMMSAIYTCIMLLWFWGSRNKTAFFNRNATNLSKLLQIRDAPAEDSQEGSAAQPDLAVYVLGRTPVCRLPGVALYYSDVLYGAPPALERHVTRFPVLHAVNVVLTVRSVPVPEVRDFERFLVKQLPLPGFYHVVARYGYGETVRQDDEFADAVLQRISVLLYGLLHDGVKRTPELQRILHALPPIADSSTADGSTSERAPILDKSDAETEAKSLRTGLSAPLPSPFQPEFTAINMSDSKRALTQKSAPSAGVASAYTALRPHASAHGFTDSSFRAVPDTASSAGSAPDGKTAALLAAWARQVASGEVRLGPAHDEMRQLAREVAALTTAKDEGVVYVMGVAQARSSPRASLVKKYLVHEPFLFLVHNFTSHPDLAYGVPADRLSLVGLPYLLD